MKKVFLISKTFRLKSKFHYHCHHHVSIQCRLWELCYTIPMELIDECHRIIHRPSSTPFWIICPWLHRALGKCCDKWKKKHFSDVQQLMIHFLKYLHFTSFCDQTFNIHVLKFKLFDFSFSWLFGFASCTPGISLFQWKQFRKKQTSWTKMDVIKGLTHVRCPWWFNHIHLWSIVFVICY